MKELVDAKHGEVFQMSIWAEQFTKYPEGHWGLSAKRLGGQFFSHGLTIDPCAGFGKHVRGVHMGTNYGTPWMERKVPVTRLLSLKTEQWLSLLLWV